MWGNKSGEVAEQSLSACSNQIRWLIDHIALDHGMLVVDGWALSGSLENASEVRFLVNGEDFENLNYPAPSPDVAEVFWNIPGASQARFFAWSKITETTFKDGFACMEFVTAADRELSRQTAWYYPDPETGPALPEDSRIRRVIGATESRDYLLGGAAIFKRFDYYLEKTLGRPLNSFANVLDWGCGSGRVSRHFHLLPQTNLWGVDIDADNVNWCQTNLPHGKFTAIGLSPPTELPDNYFDLIIGISVFTHLDEDSQFAWLKELHRVASPGAIVMLSIQGLALSALYKTPRKIIAKIEREGFYTVGRNSDLDDVMAGNSHYLDVIQSRDYIHREWGKYFTVLDIVDAMAANQDVVVLRKD